MAAIDFPTSPTNGQLFTPATGITYRYLTSPGIWTVVNGPVNTVISSDTPPASPVPNQLWFNSVLGALYVYFQDADTTQWVPASPAFTGSGLLQTVSTQTGAVATGTTVIPFDNTIPQITEGDQYMTLAITPKSATSKLIINVVINLATSAAGVVGMIASLFQDATPNALATATNTSPAAGNPCLITFRHAMTSGTTSATTFRVRAGVGGAGTTTFNGVSGGAFFGGTLASSIVIQEVL